MPSKSKFLPYGRQDISDDDIDAVVKVLKSNYLTGGPVTEEFENALTKQTGAQHAIACSSGTAALHMAVMALGIGPGDVVIVPSITFLATANAARFVGADVMFCDVDPNSGLMRPEDLNEAIKLAGPKAKAVILVHLAGQCVDMTQIAGIAAKHGLGVIEDASHALGSVSRRDDGVAAVGSCDLSDMAVFSFHPVKTVAMGEGGAVTTNDPALAERLRLVGNHGLIRDAEMFVNKDMASDDNDQANPWFYEMPALGYNYRTSEIHCALGLSQLKKLDRFISRRRALVARYDQVLAELSPIPKPIDRVSGDDPAWHLYIVLIDFENLNMDRAALMNGLRDNNIGSQVHYIPVHLQPYYRELYGSQKLFGTLRYYERCLSLPLFPAMTDQDVDRVAAVLTQLLANAARG